MNLAGLDYKYLRLSIHLLQVELLIVENYIKSLIYLIEQLNILAKETQIRSYV